MNEPNPTLMECVRFWQARLRLGDWQIAVQQAEPNELERSEARARVDMQPFQREASIVLRSLEIFDAATEQEIIHELLHLVFAHYGLWMGTQDDSAHLPMEQAINATGAALLELRLGQAEGFDCRIKRP